MLSLQLLVFGSKTRVPQTPRGKGLQENLPEWAVLKKVRMKIKTTTHCTCTGSQGSQAGARKVGAPKPRVHLAAVINMSPRSNFSLSCFLQTRNFSKLECCTIIFPPDFITADSWQRKHLAIC